MAAESTATEHAVLLDDVSNQALFQDLENTLLKAAELLQKVGAKRLDNEFCTKHFGPKVRLLLQEAGLLPARSSSAGHAWPVASRLEQHRARVASRLGHPRGRGCLKHPESGASRVEHPFGCGCRSHPESGARRSRPER